MCGEFHVMPGRTLLNDLCARTSYTHPPSFMHPPFDEGSVLPLWGVASPVGAELLGCGERRALDCLHVSVGQGFDRIFVLVPRHTQALRGGSFF